VTGAPESSGVYLFVFDLRRECVARVGALGLGRLAAGRYGYVGSARRGLAARLARHARRRKPLRWHIDALARCSDPAGALAWPWREGRECRLAEALTATGMGRSAIPRFGASDCGCGGHLFALSEGDLDRLAKALSKHLGVASTLVLCY